MANFITSPNMNLTIPTTGIESGPNWANDVNSSLVIIDQHNHAAGSGIQITPTGLNININLPFNNNAATGLAYLNIVPQGAGIPTPVNASIYVNGIDLYYKNGSGAAVQLTLGANVNATSSGISSGTAAASFVSNILTVVQSPAVGAAIDAASYILRYNGSYPTPSGNAIVLAAPASISGTYQLTFPASTPGANNSAMVVNTAGGISYLTPDGIAQAMTATGANAIASTMTSAGANTIASTMTATGANAIGVTMTNTGSNAIGQSMTTIGADAIANTMTVTGANAIGADMTNANLNLQIGSKFAAVAQSSANSRGFGIMRGICSLTGTIIAGEGFSVTNNGAGLATINFTNAGTGQWVPTVSPWNGGANITVNVQSSSASGFQVQYVSGSTPVNGTITFIAIGPR